jgi:hypothetical protein
MCIYDDSLRWGWARVSHRSSHPCPGPPTYYYNMPLLVAMGYKKIDISNGQHNEQLTPEEFTKIVKCLEPLKDEFDFEFNMNVKF